MFKVVPTVRLKLADSMEWQLSTERWCFMTGPLGKPCQWSLFHTFCSPPCNCCISGEATWQDGCPWRAGVGVVADLHLSWC